jgi:hypothetical protein
VCVELANAATCSLCLSVLGHPIHNLNRVPLARMMHRCKVRVLPVVVVLRRLATVAAFTRRATRLSDEVVWQCAPPAGSAGAGPRFFLGLDLNTNGSGYAIADAAGMVVAWGHIDTRHESCTLAVARCIRSQVLALKQQVEARVPGCTWGVMVEGAHVNR